MIFTKNGHIANDCYDCNKISQQIAYDVEGNIVFSRTRTLKVMTYNVGGWYDGKGTNVPSAYDSLYYELQNGMIERANADIACFCEYWDEFSQTGRTAASILAQYYPYYYVWNGSDHWFGNAIYSKYPIVSHQSHIYSDTLSGKINYYDEVVLDIEGRNVNVFITHMETNDHAVRVAELEELIEYLQTLPYFICCGDYNTLYAKSTSGIDYQDMILKLIDAGFNLANCADFGFLYTYSSKNEDNPPWVGCLDNIVVNGDAVLSDVYVDDTKLNIELPSRVDHMPLISTVRFEF